jgi:hypothetical protein
MQPSMPPPPAAPQLSAKPSEIKLDGTHSFVVPVKKINLMADLEAFK